MYSDVSEEELNPHFKKDKYSGRLHYDNRQNRLRIHGRKQNSKLKTILNFIN
jgi:hypothetical protein